MGATKAGVCAVPVTPQVWHPAGLVSFGGVWYVLLLCGDAARWVVAAPAEIARWHPARAEGRPA